MDCTIGAFTVVGSKVVLADRVRIDSHVIIDGSTTIGSDTHVFPFASIGLAPQDLKYKGEDTLVVIGERNLIHEYVTVHRGTPTGRGVTTIGSDCLLMVQSHIAHDCTVGSDVIMANAATLGGHVEIGDRVNIGGLSGIHQFCRVGREAFVGGSSIAVKDVMPYSLIQGNHAKCYGMNRIGVRRRGYSQETIAKLNHAFHVLLTAKLNTTQALERIKSEITGDEQVDLLIDFIETSRRGVVK